MRHLKLFENFDDLKLFENKSIDDDVETLRNILLEVEDDGFKTSVFKIEVESYIDKSLYLIELEISKDQMWRNMPFEFTEISDCVYRIVDYMESVGYKTNIWIGNDFNSLTGSSLKSLDELEFVGAVVMKFSLKY